MEAKAAAAQDPLRLEGSRVDGDFVRGLREELGMSQKAFADYLGLSAGTIATWERRGKLSAAGQVLLREVDIKTAEQRQAFNKLIAQGVGR